MILLRVLLMLAAAALLTVLTQIGGLVLLIAWAVWSGLKWQKGWQRWAAFLGLYLLVTLAVVPLVARPFGRVPIAHTEQMKPLRWATVLMNRNYVKPEWNRLLSKMSADLAPEGVTMLYLDANFPFAGMPLLPHLSHKDGEKLDLALVYEDAEGQITAAGKSVTGYGAYDGPLPGEFDQSAQCAKQGRALNYQMTRWMSLGTFNDDLKFSVRGNRALLQSFFRHHPKGKCFLERHLKNRIGSFPNIGFQGCHSVRHDDHIHLQLNGGK